MSLKKPVERTMRARGARAPSSVMNSSFASTISTPEKAGGVDNPHGAERLDPGVECLVEPAPNW